jgi:hypothetical protein
MEILVIIINMMTGGMKNFNIFNDINLTLNIFSKFLFLILYFFENKIK